MPIRIVLHGLTGPLKVNGEEWNMTMPGLAATLDDEWIAGILTYIRSEWENQATAITAAKWLLSVARILTAIARGQRSNCNPKRPVRTEAGRNYCWKLARKCINRRVR